MHAADEIIPRMPRGQLADPILVAGQIIHFQREADGELRKGFLRPPDFGDVFIKLPVEHPPAVEILLRHRRMVGKADLRQTQRDGLAGIIHRLARRVAAERRVHVQIGRQRHGRSFKFQDSRFKLYRERGN